MGYGSINICGQISRRAGALDPTCQVCQLRSQPSKCWICTGCHMLSSVTHCTSELVHERCALSDVSPESSKASLPSAAKSIHTKQDHKCAARTVAACGRRLPRRLDLAYRPTHGGQQRRAGTAWQQERLHGCRENRHAGKTRRNRARCVRAHETQGGAALQGSEAAAHDLVGGFSC